MQFPVGETPLLVFMHENAGNLGMRIPYYNYIIDNLGVNILSMAYRGYSYSDAVPPDEAGLKRDANAILKFLNDPSGSGHTHLAEHINRSLIFAHGRSLGAAVAIYMAHESPTLFRGLIVEHAFLSIGDMVDHLFFFVKYIKWAILKMDWNNARIVPTLKLPILFLAGDQDDTIPSEQTDKLHDLSTSAHFKELHIIKGGGHNDSWIVGGTEYLSGLDYFIRKCIRSYQGAQQGTVG